MTMNRDEWISKRAYELWEAAGSPHGLDQHHWDQAAAEFDAAAAGSAAKARPTAAVAAKPKRKTPAKRDTAPVPPRPTAPSTTKTQ